MAYILARLVCPSKLPQKDTQNPAIIQRNPQQDGDKYPGVVYDKKHALLEIVLYRKQCTSCACSVYASY